jgi:phage terminase large subunit GpA-like protein
MGYKTWYEINDFLLYGRKQMIQRLNCPNCEKKFIMFFGELITIELEYKYTYIYQCPYCDCIVCNEQVGNNYGWTKERIIVVNRISKLKRILKWCGFINDLYIN